MNGFFVPNFVACLVFLGIAFSFMKLISLPTHRQNEAKREEAILKNIVLSPEVIIANMTPFSANESARISIIT